MEKMPFRVRPTTIVFQINRALQVIKSNIKMKGGNLGNQYLRLSFVYAHIEADSS